MEKANNKKTSRRRKKPVKMRSQGYLSLPPDWYLECSNCGHVEKGRKSHKSPQINKDGELNARESIWIFSVYFKCIYHVVTTQKSSKLSFIYYIFSTSAERSSRKAGHCQCILLMLPKIKYILFQEHPSFWNVYPYTWRKIYVNWGCQDCLWIWMINLYLFL